MKKIVCKLSDVEKSEVLSKFGLNKIVIDDIHLIPISEYIIIKDLGDTILLIVDTYDEQYTEHYLTYEKNDEKYILIDYKFSYFDEWDGLYYNDEI